MLVFVGVCFSLHPFSKLKKDPLWGAVIRCASHAREIWGSSRQGVFLEGSFNATHFFFWEIKVDAKSMQWNIFTDFSKKSCWVDVIFHETPDYKFMARNWLVFWTICDQESLGYSDKHDILYKNEITENFKYHFSKTAQIFDEFFSFSQRNHLGKGYALKKRLFCCPRSALPFQSKLTSDGGIWWCP